MDNQTISLHHPPLISKVARFPAIPISGYWLQWIALGGLVLVGLFLRLYQLEYKSLWVDEILQVLAARNGVPGVLAHVREHLLGRPPVDYLLTAGTRTLGESEFILRFPAAAWGACTIALSFVLARRLTGSCAVGLLAALLLTVSPLPVHFAQEVRFYSLSILFALLLVYLFVRAWDQPTAWRWVLFSLAAIGAVFSYYDLLLILAAVSVAALVSSLPFFSDRPRPPRRAWFGFGTALLVPLLMLALWFTWQGLTAPEAFQFNAPTPTDLLVKLVFDLPVNSPSVQVLIFAVGVILFPALALGSLVQSVRRRRSWGVLLALIVILGIAGVLLADWRAPYFFYPRQLLFIVPFYLILVAAGLDSVRRAIPQRPTLAGAAIVIILVFPIVLCGLSITADYDTPKDDWRAAAQLITQSAARAPNIIVSNPPGLQPYLFYYQPSLKEHFVAATKLASGEASRRVWYVTWGHKKYSVPPELAAQPGWNSIALAVSPSLQLSYSGKAGTAQLRRELAALNLPPQGLLYSDFLAKLRANDPTLASEVAARAVQTMQTMHPPLLNAQQEQLLRQVNGLTPAQP